MRVGKMNRAGLLAASAAMGLIACVVSLASAQQGTPRSRVLSPHGELSMPCENCHTNTSWKPIRGIPEFDHDDTKFPLRGMHVRVSCRNCHNSMVFSNVGKRCADCHADIHRRQNGANCETCHTVNGWRVTLRSMQQHLNRFPLTGSHMALQCDSCHVESAAGKFKGLSPDCGACHIDAFNKTTRPDHRAAGFPSDCSICHSPRSWVPAVFDHARTGFPLEGAHKNLACSSCHPNGNFKGASAACASCHMKDYDGTTNPNHRAAGFPTDCAMCHNMRAWRPAAFDHNRTGFLLTGAHRTIPCASCHVGGRYSGTPADCYSCHQKEYQSTTSPNHIAAHFPTTCSSCHNTTTWQGAVFNHTWFPIFNGKHAGKWSSCTDCHVNASNYTVFSCTTCHEHDRAKVDPKHREVRGYTYSPTSCYSCHPTGQGD